MLSPAQNDHIVDLQREFCLRLRDKYTKGAEEHGGNLKDMPPIQLIENALNECIDQFTYLMTLREQLLTTFNEPKRVGDLGLG